MDAAIHARVFPNTYRDSVELMQIAADIEAMAGIDRAGLVMATPANREVLAAAGLLSDRAAAAGPNDLVVAVASNDKDVAEAALERAAARLSGPGAEGASQATRIDARTIAEAQAELGNGNLALISTPGTYATAEALKALKRGLNVFLFSDNVPIEDEIELKSIARQKGLLVMGPDCGTAILDGVPLGFANAVRRGTIGLVAASGTGLQQVSCLIDQAGAGVSQAIGVGGRDLDERVGGVMMLTALERLAEDPGTDLIVLISKPPAASVAERVLGAAGRAGKPVIVAFLGGDRADIEAAGAIPARTFDEAATIAAAMALGLTVPDPSDGSGPGSREADAALATEAADSLTAGQRRIRGLYSGGSLAGEAKLVLRDAIGVDAAKTHEILDLGDDEYTVGRPHPMIDPRLRNEHIAAVAADPTTAVILLDVVLGYGSNADPAGAVAPAIEAARATARAAGRPIAVVAAVCGTDRDPQVRSAQEARLAASGVIVARSNAAAAAIAARIATRSVAEAEASRPAPTATLQDGPIGDGAASVLFSEGVRAVNVGLEMFAEPLATHGATVASIEWRPPADGDRDLGLVLARLEDDPGDPVGRMIVSANATAVERLLAAQPMLVDVQPARAVLGLADRQILHSGPPIDWERMCGPVRGAITGAILLEGWADTANEAVELAASGRIALSPCHHHGAVGPMAGVVSPSMPVVVVENVTGGTRAFATLNEGLGKVLRFGAYDSSVLERLRWFALTLAPALSAALRAGGPLDLRGLTGQALQMGDEGHNRNIAATSLFTRTIAPAVVRTADAPIAAAVLDFLRSNDHFFLNLSMAACKSALDAAHGIAGSTVVTAMARNGVDFGVRMSGTGDAWFTTPVGVPDGLYFPGYGPDDANPDLGDSAITETFGIGGFAMAAAPAIVRFVGGSPADALEFTRLMGRITLARNPSYALPPLGFVGTPTGIDARRVVDSGIAPVINTGIAHKQAGVGQIGAGIARAPLACFGAALIGLAGLLDVPASGSTTRAAASTTSLQ